MDAQHYMLLCRFLTVDIFEMTIVKFCLGLLKLSLSFVLLLQTCLFLRKFELNYFVKYAPLYFITLYVLVCIMCQSYTTRIVTTHLPPMVFWKIDEATKEIKKQVTRTWVLITLYMVASVVSSFLLAAAYMVPTPKDNDFIYAFKIMRQCFPQWASSLIFGGRLSNFVSCYMGVSTPAFTVYYYYGHVKLQTLMFKHHLENINENCIKIEHISSNNVEYHRMINERLLFFVRCHVNLLKKGRKALGLAEVYVLPYQIIGTMCMASIVLFWFTFQGSLSSQYLRIIAHAVTALVTFVGIIGSGQGIEDLAAVYTGALNEVEWYNWDENNKRIYLIVLMNTTKVSQIKYSENIALNYRLGLQMSQAVFSAISVIYHLQR